MLSGGFGKKYLFSLCIVLLGFGIGSFASLLLYDKVGIWVSDGGGFGWGVREFMGPPKSGHIYLLLSAPIICSQRGSFFWPLSKPHQKIVGTFPLAN